MCELLCKLEWLQCWSGERGCRLYMSMLQCVCASFAMFAKGVTLCPRLTAQDCASIHQTVAAAAATGHTVHCTHVCCHVQCVVNKRPRFRDAQHTAVKGSETVSTLSATTLSVTTAAHCQWVLYMQHLYSQHAGTVRSTDLSTHPRIADIQRFESLVKPTGQNHVWSLPVPSHPVMRGR